MEIPNLTHCLLCGSALDSNDNVMYFCHNKKHKFFRHNSTRQWIHMRFERSGLYLTIDNDFIDCWAYGDKWRVYNDGDACKFFGVSSIYEIDIIEKTVELMYLFS